MNLMHILKKFHCSKLKKVTYEIPEKPDGVHVQEVEGHRHEGEELHQILTRGAVLLYVT
jgi:hypothetical protein